MTSIKSCRMLLHSSDWVLFIFIALKHNDPNPQATKDTTYLLASLGRSHRKITSIIMFSTPHVLCFSRGAWFLGFSQSHKTVDSACFYNESEEEDIFIRGMHENCSACFSITQNGSCFMFIIIRR